MYNNNLMPGNGPRRSDSDGFNYSRGFKSRVERTFFDILSQKGIRFVYEPDPFYLIGEVKYTPDFLLDIQKNNKTIILEPHGIWAKEEVHSYFLGNKRGTLIAPGQYYDETELRVVRKYSEFRKLYGKQYYLILFVPWKNYTYVKTQYSRAFDEIYAFEQLPEVIEKLAKKRRSS